MQTSGRSMRCCWRAPSFVGCGHHAESHVQYQPSQAINQVRLCAQQRSQRSSPSQSLHAMSAAQERFRLQLCSPHENSEACSSLPGLCTVSALAQQHGVTPSNAATLAIHSPARRGSQVARAGGGSLMEVFQAIQAQMQGMAASEEPPLADVEVSQMTFHPAGTMDPLLWDISFRVPSKKLGLIYGRSGAGKTTLLQLIAGLTNPTSGSISITETTGQGAKSTVSTSADRLARTGLVFQFPERHFLASTLQQELVFAWPPDAASLQLLSSRAAIVLPALGLSQVPLETPLRQLSDGYKRRCALAVALVRRPSVLLLDEPLAGLDWKSRADIASVLGKLKEECTVIVVSHDLREIAPLVDVAWEMQPNGTLSAQQDISQIVGVPV